MRRAGIFIGVDRTGNLPQLHDAAEGARRMHTWATGQGMADGTQATLITDADGRRVGPDDIYQAIQAIGEGPGVDQLIVYFAGHGVNLNLSEVWLLSDAPVRASAAVDVTASAETARDFSIPHVVFISDACRIAPSGAQAQRVRGQVIFPNEPTGQRRVVDQFFACAPTRTAAEVRDPADVAVGYVAIYTRVLLDALRGDVDQVLEKGGPGDPADALYVRGGTLERYLESAVPARIEALGLLTVDQEPDAKVLGYDRWLSQVARTRRFIPETPRLGPPPLRRRLTSILVDEAVAAADAADRVDAPDGVDVVDGGADGGADGGDGGDGVEPEAVYRAPAFDLADLARDLGRDGAAAAEQFVQDVESLATPVGPPDASLSCGVMVRGRRITHARGVGVQLRHVDDRTVAVDDVEGPGATLLVRFENGVGTLVPVIPGLVASLTFSPRGDLVDVDHEPAPAGRYGHVSPARVEAAARLRAAVAIASDRGRLRLDEDQLNGLRHATVTAEPPVPALALYTAYACHDLQLLDGVREISSRLTQQVGVTVFDLELLRVAPVVRGYPSVREVLSPVPFLSRGWSIVRGRGLTLLPAPAQETLIGSLLESQWCLYDRAGCDVLQQAMQRGEIR